MNNIYGECLKIKSMASLWKLPFEIFIFKSVSLIVIYLSAVLVMQVVI